MNGDTGYELFKRVAAISDKIRALESLQSQSAEVASILEELNVASAALPDPTWRSLRESIPRYQEMLTMKATDEEFIQSRSTIADALDLNVGACLLKEQTNRIYAAVDAIQNFDWERLQAYVPQIKAISDLSPVSIAKHHPQEFERNRLWPIIMERLAEVLPLLTQATKPHKVAEALESLEDLRQLARNQPTVMEEFNGIEAMVLMDRLKTETVEATRAMLESRLKQFTPEKGAPLLNVAQASNLLWQASEYLVDGTKSQQTMNLEEATKSMDQALELLDAAGTQLGSGDTDNVAARSMSDMIEGLRAFVSGRRAYASALRAGIMGELQKKHIDDLKESDSALFDSRLRLKKAGLVRGSTPEQTDAITDAIVTQRVANSNLWRLGQLSLSPGHTSRVAVPMFLVFFVASFVVITITLRLSGTIDTLGATTIGFLVVASFAASLIATFGYQANKFLGFLNALTGFWRKG